MHTVGVIVAQVHSMRENAIQPSFMPLDFRFWTASSSIEGIPGGTHHHLKLGET
jgi:hypothetical protein